jgi:hypothetical protein
MTYYASGAKTVIRGDLADIPALKRAMEGTIISHILVN